MGRVEEVKVLIMQLKRIIDGEHQVLPNNCPTVFEEQPNKSVGPWSFFRSKIFYHCVQLFHSEVLFQMSKISSSQLRVTSRCSF
jgi:hypothetical protein